MSRETPSELRLTIPFDPSTSSKNARYSRNAARDRAMRREIAANAAAAALYAWTMAGCPEWEVPVDVTLLVRRGRALDDDNALHGCAHLRDRIFNRVRFGNGITPDDSQRWFRWREVIFETGRQWKDRPEVVLIVRPRAEEDA
jgi:hypothetical protein